MVNLCPQPIPADMDLKRRILNYLFGQHFSDLRRLEVSADNGVVTIRGRVSSFHQRQLCIHCCQRVAGVVRVKDEIDVVPART